MNFIDQLRLFRERHKGMLLLFRVGDFWEAYQEDAHKLARSAGVAVTTRGDLPMAGVPHRYIEKNLQKLLQDGHRVALCERVVEDGKAKAVERIVVDASGLVPEVRGSSLFDAED